MALSLQVNNKTFQYPEENDILWGQEATNWAAEVSLALGSVFENSGGDVATAGVIRLPNNDRISWRNAGNTNNVSIYVDASNDLIYDDGISTIVLNASAAGNVTGPGSSTDEAIARYDGVTGQLIQDSVVTINDAGDISAVNILTASTVNVTNLNVGGTPVGDLFIEEIVSSTDNALVRWDGVSGSAVQDSGILIDDSDNITLPASVTISGSSGHSVSPEFANEVIEEYERPTGASVGLRGVAESANIDDTFSSTSYVDVTNSTITIQSTGRPIMLCLVPSSSSNDSFPGYVQINESTNSTIPSASANISLVRNTDGGGDTDVFFTSVFLNLDKDTGGSTDQFDLISSRVPAGAVQFLDVPASGSHVYKLQVKVGSIGTESVNIRNCKFIAYEL